MMSKISNRSSGCANPKLILIFNREKLGWGTWIRTRTNGVRVRGSTVNLFPNGRLYAAAAMACAGRHIIELSKDANPLLLVLPILFALAQAPGQKALPFTIVINPSDCVPQTMALFVEQMKRCRRERQANTRSRTSGCAVRARPPDTSGRRHRRGDGFGAERFDELDLRPECRRVVCRSNVLRADAKRDACA